MKKLIALSTAALFAFSFTASAGAPDKTDTSKETEKKESKDSSKSSSDSEKGSTQTGKTATGSEKK